MASVPTPGRDQYPTVQRSAGLRLSWLLRYRWMSCRRQEFYRGDDNPGSGQDEKPDDLRLRPRLADRLRRGWPSRRRELSEKRQGVLPAGARGSAGVLYLRKLA